jgi:hypothetical protein
MQRRADVGYHFHRSLARMDKGLAQSGRWNIGEHCSGWSIWIIQNSTDTKKGFQKRSGAR